jgi:hypothetical protein
MTNTTVLEGLEEQREDAKRLIERRELMLRLVNNPDYRAAITEGFILKDCARFAHQASDPTLTREQREDAMEMAKAAGHLKRYVSMTIQMGWKALNDLPELEAEIEEARLEEDGAE